jgi:hypothetical protein
MAAEKRPCEALNKRGKGCRNDALPGSPYCASHQGPEGTYKPPPNRWSRHAAALARKRKAGDA